MEGTWQTEEVTAALRPEADDSQWDEELGAWTQWQDERGEWDWYQWYQNPRTTQRRWRRYGDCWNPETQAVVDEDDEMPESAEVVQARRAAEEAAQAADEADKAWGVVLLLRSDMLINPLCRRWNRMTSMGLLRRVRRTSSSRSWVNCCCRCRLQTLTLV